MKRIAFYFAVLVISIRSGSNRGTQNNSQQGLGQDQGMAPNGGFQGRGQGNFDPTAMADRQIAQMKETLNFTEEQQKQLREIMVQNSEEMQKMREQMQQMRDNRMKK